MERVARRFLLHNRRENEDVKESDFDDLKQELNMAKFEMLNNSKLIKENIKDYESVLRKGFNLLGQYFFSNDDTELEGAKKHKNIFSRKRNSENENLIEADDLSDPFSEETTKETKSGIVN